MNDFISVVGMYNFSPDLFDNMHLPEALDNEEDRETLIDNLVSECAELELLYLNPDFLSIMIERWSRKRLPIWEKLYQTTQYDYDPISNYDRTEESTDVLDSGTAPPAERRTPPIPEKCPGSTARRKYPEARKTHTGTRPRSLTKTTAGTKPASIISGHMVILA